MFAALLSCFLLAGCAYDDGSETDTQADGGSADVASADGGGADVAVTIAPIVINEVAPKGAKAGTFNPTGSDWAELYNAGDSVVDLENWRVIDSKSKGFNVAFPLPKNTKIAAKGYLLIWFNHDSAGSPVIDKKLGGDEALSVYHPSGALADMVNWEAEDSVPAKSWGRTPDGGSVFVIFDKPTPGAANK